MGKKIDIIKKAAAPLSSAAPVTVAPETTPAPAEASGPKKAPRRARALKPASPKTPKAAKPRASAPAAPVQITRDDIALRAYFIAEKRHREGLPGNSESDWLEAERQLREEAAAKKSRARQSAKANDVSA